MTEDAYVSPLDNENTLIAAGLAAAFTHFLLQTWMTIVFATLVIILLQQRSVESSSKRYIVSLTHIAIIGLMIIDDGLTTDEIVLGILHLNLASCYFFNGEDNVHSILNTSALVTSGLTGMLSGWSTTIVVGVLMSLLLWREHRTQTSAWRIPTTLWGCTLGILLAFEAISGGFLRVEEVTPKGIQSWKMLLLGPTLGATIFETLRSFIEDYPIDEEE